MNFERFSNEGLNHKPFLLSLVVSSPELKFSWKSLPIPIVSSSLFSIIDEVFRHCCLQPFYQVNVCGVSSGDADAVSAAVQLSGCLLFGELCARPSPCLGGRVVAQVRLLWTMPLPCTGTTMQGTWRTCLLIWLARTPLQLSAAFHCAQFSCDCFNFPRHQSIASRAELASSAWRTEENAFVVVLRIIQSIPVNLHTHCYQELLPDSTLLCRLHAHRVDINLVWPTMDSSGN